MGRSDAEGSQRRRQRDRRVRNRLRMRVDAPVIEVVKRDPQERVEEPTAEPLPGIAEYSVARLAEVVALTSRKTLQMVVKFGLKEWSGSTGIPSFETESSSRPSSSLLAFQT